MEAKLFFQEAKAIQRGRLLFSVDSFSHLSRIPKAIETITQAAQKFLIPQCHGTQLSRQAEKHTYTVPQKNQSHMQPVTSITVPQAFCKHKLITSPRDGYLKPKFTNKKTKTQKV